MNQKELSALDLKRMREKCGVSQAVFSNIICCPLKTYQRWEQEGCKPYIHELLLLAFYSIYEIAIDTDDTSLRFASQSEPDPEQVEIDNFDDHHEELDYLWDTNFWCIRD